MKKNYDVSYSDPFIKKIPKLRNYKFNLKSTKIDKNKLIKFDLVVLITDHDIFNYNKIYKYSKLILDTRGIFKK